MSTTLNGMTAYAIIIGFIIFFAGIIIYWDSAVNVPAQRAWCSSRGTTFTTYAKGRFCEDREGRLYRIPSL